MRREKRHWSKLRSPFVEEELARELVLRMSELRTMVAFARGVSSSSIVEP